ncbi:MAG TPA: DUF3710 domain-containing protein [Dermatophilaceae bacterium]|nr:DUF3710 domain-containing protein [Dermatophilaceae bacterium]
MGIFSRGKARGEEATGLDAAEMADEQAGTSQASATSRLEGPFDRSDVTDDSEYLNLGPIWVKGTQGMELRLEINDQEQQITGLTAVLGESAVQLQVFAAPRTEGVWIDIRNEIAASITDSGGTAEVVTGPFGEELQTRMPQAGPDGRTGFVPARFIGIDGPRWFLRAVVSGRAAIEPGAAAPIHDLIRTAVIDRGGEAMPPRELLPLRLPEQAQPDAAPAEPEPPRSEDLKPFERGPEITEVR